MAIQTQFRRGNTYSHSLFTGASGEITVDLDKKVAVVHDGATVGGHPLSLYTYTTAAYNQANTATTIATLAFNAANVAAAYTVAGVTGNVSNIQLASGITSSGLLTTANISELTNLYFTNARARESITIASSNVSGKGSYDNATGVISINAANVTVSLSAPTNPYVGDLWIHADTAVEYLFFGDGDTFQWVELGEPSTGTSGSTVAGVTGNVSNIQLASGITQTGVLTTANVTEVTNLYFTNARAIAAITNTTLSNLTVSGNITLNNLTATGNISATGSILATPAWTSAGATTITATTTNPTKGTTTSDNISYRQLGAKQWEVILTYIQTVANGVNGSGDYLVTLPNGLSFDTTLPSQQITTTNIGTNTYALMSYIIPSGSGLINNDSLGGQVYPIVYDATKFRILTTSYGSAIQCWGSGYYSLGGDDPKIQLTFRFTST